MDREAVEGVAMFIAACVIGRLIRWQWSNIVDRFIVLA